MCRVIPGFAFKSTDWCDKGIPVVKITNISSDNRVEIFNVDCVPEALITPRTSKYLLKYGDILIAMTGATAGKVGRLLVDRQIFLNQRVAKIEPVEADRDYIWSLVSSQEYQKRFFGLADGAAQPNMSGRQIESVEIPFPPIPIQRRIASILSAYDDLIENNRKRIAILEEMARRLYREWFVHFRYPGYESVPLADSPLGRIPQGWADNLEKHVDFKEGPGLRNWQYRESGIPFLNIRALGDNEVYFSKIQFIDKAESDEKYPHFLLSEYDHVVSSSGTIGRVLTIRGDHLPLMLNTSIIRMRPKGDRVGCWQLKHFMLSEYFQGQAKAFATGAAQPNFGPIHLKQMWIVAPDESLSKQYEQIVEPWEKSILVFAQMIKNLRRTRDLLLPHLMSGQLSITAAEAAVP